MRIQWTLAAGLTMALAASALSGLAGCRPEPSVNRQPVLSALTVQPEHLPVGSVATFQASAMDPDGDILAWSWTVPAGTVDGSGSQVTWTAQGAPGSYEVAVTVNDGRGGSASGMTPLWIVATGASANKPPAVTSFTTAPVQVMEGEEVVSSAVVSDPEGDALTFRWHLPGEMPVSGGASFTWVARGVPGTNAVRLVVTDTSGSSTAATSWIYLFPLGKYVSLSGDDANPGTPGQPWRTFASAATRAVAGDTVYVRGGTWAERLLPRRSGQMGQPITWMAFPGETVTIDGSLITWSNDGTWGGLIEIHDQSHVRISGFRVLNSTAAGIFAWNTGSHLQIDHNYTYNTNSSGIGLWRYHHVTVTDNEVELACNDGGQECISVVTARTFEIARNRVHHAGPGTNGGEGIDAKDGSSYGSIHHNIIHDIANRLAIYVDSAGKYSTDITVYSNQVDRCKNAVAIASEDGGPCENVRVFGNTARDCTGEAYWITGWGTITTPHPLKNIEMSGNVAAFCNCGFAIAAQTNATLETIKLFNNLSYRNNSRGIWVGGIQGAKDGFVMKDIQILNNTVVDNGLSAWGGGITLSSILSATGVVVRNNIFSQNGDFQIKNGPDVGGVTIDHNLIDGFRNSGYETRGAQYVEGNPLFVNKTGEDYRLQTGSPAIDQGSLLLAPAQDFDGRARPLGGAVDMGAYEIR